MGGGGDAVDHRAKVRLPGDNFVQTHLPQSRGPGIDKRRRRAAQKLEKLQPRRGRQHQLAVRRQQILPLQALDDFGPGRGGADALGFLQSFAQGGSSTKRHAFCMASTSVPSL